MIILASSSPRRKELLKTIVDNFVVVSSDCDESIKIKKPKKIALELAERKALCVLGSGKCDKNIDTIIASDTIVFKGGVLGKPKNKEDAIYTLKKLNGKKHKVYTAVCVIKKGKKISFLESATVKFKKLSDEQIKNYVDNFSPYDKAGSYGIQDDVCVEFFKGDYNCIMGLPLKRLKRILEDK